MAIHVDGTLWPASDTTDFRSRTDPREATGWLYPASDTDFRLRAWAGEIARGVAAAFPTQIAGLFVFYGGVVRALCMVALADDPAGPLRIDKNGTPLSIYLVDTTDPNASSVRVQTSSGTKAIRLQT